MDTHRDDDAVDKTGFLEELQRRAEAMRERRESEIAAGMKGELPLDSWRDGMMGCQQLPPDPQNILRISVGGTEGFQYLSHRGDRRQCLTLLQKAVAVLERSLPK